MAIPHLVNGVEDHDPFDLAKLRLDKSFLEGGGARKLLTTVPVGRPNPQHFIRVHPSEDYREALAVIELKEERETYVLSPEAAREMPGEYSPATIYTTITRQGAVRLWPVKLPGPDGKVNEWHRSAAEGAERAMTRWIRIRANMELGAYEIFEASAAIPDPDWPDIPFLDLVKIGFRDRLVASLDHPLVKRLRGEA